MVFINEVRVTFLGTTMWFVVLTESHSITKNPVCLSAKPGKFVSILMTFGCLEGESYERSK